jgi:3-hydroxyisobutyrate dehydrogenase-like beta-hydroxyacid dehydrogenase
VDTSSSSPYDTHTLGEDLEKLGLYLVDSPVTQERMHDTDIGRATLMVGSNSQEATDKVLPILQAMAKWVFVMGNLGAGHAMKTFNNYVSSASVVALGDALVAGQKFGLDPIQMIDVLNVGTGRNFSTSDAFREYGLSRTYKSGFQLALFLKDVGIAKEVIEHVGVETSMPDLVIKYFKEALDSLEPTADHTEFLKAWEKRAGISLKTGTPNGSTVTRLKEDQLLNS